MGEFAFTLKESSTLMSPQRTCYPVATVVDLDVMEDFLVLPGLIGQERDLYQVALMEATRDASHTRLNHVSTMSMAPECLAQREQRPQSATVVVTTQVIMCPMRRLRLMVTRATPPSVMSRRSR